MQIDDKFPLHLVCILAMFTPGVGT